MLLTEQTIREMRRNLDAQYVRDRETLDRMLELAIRQNSSPLPAEPADVAHRETINDRIAGFVGSFEGNFTMMELWGSIKKLDPSFGNEINRQAISTALWKLSKEGQVRIVIPKRGSRGAIYSHVSSDTLKGQSIPDPEPVARTKNQPRIEKKIPRPGRKKGFSPKDAILRVLPNLSGRFTKNEMFEQVVSQNPDERGTIKADVISAQMYRMAHAKDHLRFVDDETWPGKLKVYEKISE